MILYVICQLVCVIDSWAQTNFVHSILSLKLGVTDQYTTTRTTHTTGEPLGSNLEHTLKHLAHSGAPITLGPSD